MRPLLIFLLLFIAVPALLFGFWLILNACWGFGAFPKDHLEPEFCQLADSVERFRSRYQRLPESLAEMGLPDTESGPIYYGKESEQDFILYYGTTLGESCIFDPQKKQWYDTTCGETKPIDCD